MLVSSFRQFSYTLRFLYPAFVPHFINKTDGKKIVKMEKIYIFLAGTRSLLVKTFAMIELKLT